MIRGLSGGHTHELFLDHDGILYGEGVLLRGRAIHVGTLATRSLWHVQVFIRTGRQSATRIGGRTRHSELHIPVRSDAYRPANPLSTVSRSSANSAGRDGGQAARPAFERRRRGDGSGRLLLPTRLDSAASGPRRQSTDCCDPTDRKNFGLAVAPDRAILVAEHRNKRIVRVELDGTGVCRCGFAWALGAHWRRIFSVDNVCSRGIIIAFGDKDACAGNKGQIGKASGCGSVRVLRIVLCSTSDVCFRPTAGTFSSRGCQASANGQPGRCTGVLSVGS